MTETTPPGDQKKAPPGDQKKALLARTMKRHKQQGNASLRPRQPCVYGGASNHVQKGGSGSGSTVIGIPEMPFQPPNHRKNLIFMHHQKKEPPNSTIS